MTEAKQIAQELVNKLYDNITMRDIQNTLKSNPSFSNDSSVDVTVKKGIATLTGFVRNNQQSAIITETVKRTIGVTEVNNLLKPRGLANESRRNSRTSFSFSSQHA